MHSAQTAVSRAKKKAGQQTEAGLAGYHVKPGEKSALEYSRCCCTYLAADRGIRAGYFRPDEPRSKRWCGAQSLDQAVQLASASPTVSQHVDEFDLHELFGPSTSQLLETKPDAAKIFREVELESSAGLNSAAEQCEWNDDTTLEQLKSESLFKKGATGLESFGFEPGDMSEDSCSISSSDDSDSNSDDLNRRAEIDGEKNASDLVAPSDLSGKTCFKHVKSGKLHFSDKTLFGEKFFKCGRKCNGNYLQISAVPAFTAHGCMMCFGWSDTRKGDESSD